MFAFTLRGGLFDPDAVLFGVDTATVQLPWSAVIETDGQEAREPRNRELADQGVVFYPAYRWVIDSWRNGDPPLWNPLLYAGAPALGNPQLGVLDPQVGVTGLVDVVFGERIADWSLAWLAWLRLVGAAVGTWLLARAQGLGRGGAALAGVSFGTSGFLVGWLNHSLGHVAWFLPWVLLGIERLREGRAMRTLVLTAVVFAAAILGGHPETAFFLGTAAGLWCFTLPRRRRLAGLASLAAGTCLAAVSLVPFVEYVRRSGALIARRDLARVAEPDWIALGLLVIALGIWHRWHAVARASGGEGRGSGAWAGALGLGAAVVGIALLLIERGWSGGVRLTLLPDLFGAPGKTPGGYGGSGSYLEQVSAWLPLVTLGLALAAILTVREPGSPGLARRGWVMAIGVAAFLLSLGTPGLVDLFGLLPGVGHGAVVRAAPVGALMLSLLAGEGLERSTRPARVGSVAALAALLLCSLVHTPLPELSESVRAGDADDELVTFTRVPPPRPETQRARLEGWIHEAVDAHTIRTRAERVSATGEVLEDSGFELPTELSPSPWSEGVEAGAPPGARWFRSSFLRLEHLSSGYWRFSIDLYDEAGEFMASRAAGTSIIERVPRPGTWTAILMLLGLAALAFARPGLPGATLWVVLAALQGLWFCEGKNPAVPRAECFPPTRTEALLAEELGSRRFLSDPGVLPPNTGMLSGLRALDGYDGMDPDSFNDYRNYALLSGVQALLGWNARGVDYESAAFRLFGVGMLALAAPLEHPAWELVAGPGQPEPAECWLYRATDPMPRAFCVSRAISKADVLADLSGFDPRTTAFLEESGWSAPRAFTRADVRELEWTNNSVRLAADLDGDGLLVLTEQYFPGWRVEVDGQPRELLRVDSIFRGVVLEAGEHEVVFRYRAASLTMGLALTLLAAAVLSGAALHDRLRASG